MQRGLVHANTGALTAHARTHTHRRCVVYTEDFFYDGFMYKDTLKQWNKCLDSGGSLSN